MKIPALSLRSPALAAGLAALLALGASALWAQTAPPTNYTPPTAPAQGNTLASLNEDVQMLTRELNRLRLEVETLRQANENLQKQMPTPREISSQIQNAVAASRAEARTDSRADLAATRKEIVDGVAKQIEALAKSTDEQLKKLAKAIQTNTSTPGPTPANVTPRKFDTTNIPKTGINYVVKPRESLSTIARQNKSTVEWIQNANQIENVNDVPAGKEIFIPQKPATDTPAPPAN